MDPVNCNMIRIFFILLISLPVFGQNDVQYNILMIEQDSGYSLQYERLSYDAFQFKFLWDILVLQQLHDPHETRVLDYGI
jgi:hypothetical protein